MKHTTRRAAALAGVAALILAPTTAARADAPAGGYTARDMVRVHADAQWDNAVLLNPGAARTHTWCTPRWGGVCVLHWTTRAGHEHARAYRFAYDRVQHGAMWQEDFDLTAIGPDRVIR